MKSLWERPYDVLDRDQYVVTQVILHREPHVWINGVTVYGMHDPAVPAIICRHLQYIPWDTEGAMGGSWSTKATVSDDLSVRRLLQPFRQPARSSDTGCRKYWLSERSGRGVPN